MRKRFAAVVVFFVLVISLNFYVNGNTRTKKTSSLPPTLAPAPVARPRSPPSPPSPSSPPLPPISTPTKPTSDLEPSGSSSRPVALSAVKQWISEPKSGSVGYGNVPHSLHPMPYGERRARHVWWEAGCARFDCNWDEKVCDNGQDTDYSGENGLPCCVHLLRDLLMVFDHVLMEQGFDYYSAFGALLGVVRGDRLIPWTLDVDFVMLRDDIARILANDKGIQDTLARNGVSFFADFFPRICLNNLYLDGVLEKKFLYPYKSRWYPLYIPYGDVFAGYNITVDERPYQDALNCHWPSSRIFPTQRMSVYEDTFTVNVPRDPEFWLEKVYKNWRTPDAKKSQHGDTHCSDGDRKMTWEFRKEP